jgi:hypothetical protein
MKDRGDEGIKALILSACRHLLGPIARMLLRSGVTWAEFRDLSKEVFVEIARRDYGIQGRPTNVARVAMITGINRREVSRLRDVLLGRESRQISSESRISRILTGWHVDPEFCDENGAPMPLPASGDKRSLARLFKKYAGDLPHGALRKELTQLGLMEKTRNGEFVAKSRHYMRKQFDPDIVRQMGIALHEHGATLAHNIDQDRTGPPRFERMASNSNVSSKSVKALQKLVEERGEEFLEEIDSWLSEHEVEADSGGSGKPVRLGVGLFYFEDNRRGSNL